MFVIWCLYQQNSKPCSGTKFQYVENTIVCHDYQEIKIQESTQVLGVGAIPRSILVILKDDLVDVVKAGGIQFKIFENTIVSHTHYFLTYDLVLGLLAVKIMSRFQYNVLWLYSRSILIYQYLI